MKELQKIREGMSGEEAANIIYTNDKLLEEKMYVTSLSFENIYLRSDKTVTSDELAEVRCILSKSQEKSVVLILNSSDYGHGAVHVSAKEGVTLSTYNDEGDLLVYSLDSLSEGTQWKVKNKLESNIYVTSLNFFEIQDGQFTDYSFPDFLEALNIIEQFKAGKLVVVRNVKKIGDYEERYIFGALNVYHKNGYSEDGSTFVFTLVDDRMRLMQYTLMEAWMTWRVEEVRTVGEPDRLINLSSPVYDIPNSKVTFQINEITQGVHFFEGFINIGGTVCRVGETINLESMEKRKSITVMNDDGNTSLSLFLDYSSSRISLTNVFGTAPSITATGFKLIKL